MLLSALAWVVRGHDRSVSALGYRHADVQRVCGLQGRLRGSVLAQLLLVARSERSLVPVKA